MKYLAYVFFMLILASSLFSQTTSNYFESFETDVNPGWAFTAYDASINISNGSLFVESSSDEIIHMVLPFGGTKDDFSIKIESKTDGSGIDGGGFGRVGFKSLIALHLDDSINVVYSEDILSYNDGNLTFLATHPMPDGETVTLELDVDRDENNLIINASVNGVIFYSGQLNNVDEDLFYGQIMIDVARQEGETLNWSIDEIDVSYNKFIESSNNYTEDFGSDCVPWFRYGDFNYVASSISIENQKLEFSHSGDDPTWLNAILPVGVVENYEVEFECSVGENNNSHLGFSKFSDFKNYTTFYVENNSVHLGYASDSFDLQVIASQDFDVSTINKIKISSLKDNTDINMTVWINDQQVLTGTIPEADANLMLGHLVVGYDRGTVFDATIDNIVFSTNITNIESSDPYNISFNLLQNYPNPFNPSTVIEFAIPEKTNVKLIVFNSIGEEVARLANQEMAAGYHTVNFNANQLSSGIYFYRISTGDFTKTNKMMLLR